MMSESHETTDSATEQSVNRAPGGTRPQRPLHQPRPMDQLWELNSSVPGLPDDAFIHDGLVTKRLIRASALTALRPAESEMLWDLGAGAGSIMIEWLRAHPTTRAIGVERKPERRANGVANLERFAVTDRGSIVLDDVENAVETLEDPDAIFIGGGLSSGILQRCLTRLRPGGRFVAHGVTVEAEVSLAEAHARYGGELTRLTIENGDRIGAFRGWKPLRSVTMWSWVKPGDHSSDTGELNV